MGTDGEESDDWEFAGTYTDEGITVSKNKIYYRKVIEFEIRESKRTLFQVISLFIEEIYRNSFSCQYAN